jgi:hypothetical protein
MNRLLLVVIMLITAACDAGVDTGGTGSSVTGDGIRPTGTGPTGVTPILVPDLVGESASEARADLRAAGVRPRRRVAYSEEPVGTVLDQAVEPGSEVRPRRIIWFTVARRIPTSVFGNPWGYNWNCCRFIRDPPSAFCSYFKCVPNFSSGTGWVIQCEDRTFSQSGTEFNRGSCSQRDGVYRPLLQMTGRYAVIV